MKFSEKYKRIFSKKVLTEQKVWSKNIVIFTDKGKERGILCLRKKEIKTNAMRFLDDHNVEYNHFEFDASSDAAKTGIGVADIIGKDHKSSV